MDDPNKVLRSDQLKATNGLTKKTRSLGPNSGRRLIVVLVLIIAVFGLVFWFHSAKKDNKPKSKTPSQTVLPAGSSAGSPKLTQYTSNGSDLNLSFNYPSNWSATPASNNNSSDQTITLTSPLSSITNASNSPVTGKVVVQIRPGSATMNELNSNNPVVALTSTQIAYSQPTAAQYQYPYLSYIHFSNSSKASGAFEEVVVSGSVMFSQGESINASYLSGLDPIISANFYSCSTQSCGGSGESSLSINSGTWQNASIFQQTLAIFDSMKLN